MESLAGYDAWNFVESAQQPIPDSVYIVGVLGVVRDIVENGGCGELFEVEWDTPFDPRRAAVAAGAIGALELQKVLIRAFSFFPEEVLDDRDKRAQWLHGQVPGSEGTASSLEELDEYRALRLASHYLRSHVLDNLEDFPLVRQALLLKIEGASRRARSACKEIFDEEASS